MKKILLLFSLFLAINLNAQEAYYDDVDLTKSGLSLKDELATKTINAHTNTLSYGWPALQATDVNPENSNEVLLIYGYSTSGTTARTSQITNICSSSCPTGAWNREHVYPKSLGTPNLGTSGPGADGHHLRPSDVAFNGQRGSKKFADGSGNAGDVAGGWYPGDEWKGDVARIMMYMYIRYGSQCLPTGVGIGSSASTPDDMIDLFLEWNVEDPVSDFERQRNTYHENTSNSFAQGNRNPFIDNAYLATRIWGGDNAIDSWGIYISSDTEAPTEPTNISLSNITISTIDVSWNASTDNVAVTKYEIYVNGNLNGETANTSYTTTGLNSNTTYAFTVLAKDIANNKSAQSTAANGTTLIDNTAPTVPTNITISNEAGNSFNVNWTASTDNSSVIEYDVFVDGNLNGTTTNTNYTVTGLVVSTTYAVSILAKDITNNMSAQSAIVNGTTTDGSSNVSELFFSEYVEGSGENKALEIINLTGNNINLSPYTIKRQSGGTWETPLQLTGTIAINNVFVIINSSTNLAKLHDEKDMEVANVTPLNFNGDDRVGLFKNNVLIDIIGDLDGTDVFAKNVTLRRNSDVIAPSTDYSEQREWDNFPTNTVSDIGNFNSTLSVLENNILNNIKIYPNPANGNNIKIKTTETLNINFYNVLGKFVKKITISKDKNNIDISSLSKGVYILKINSDKKSVIKKLIKN